LRHVYGRKYLSARGFQQYAVAGQATSVNGAPAVDLRELGVDNEAVRDNHQNRPHDDSRDQAQDDSSEHTIMPPFAAFANIAPNAPASPVGRVTWASQTENHHFRQGLMTLGTRLVPSACKQWLSSIPLGIFLVLNISSNDRC
jgi:hypothetical protein